MPHHPGCECEPCANDPRQRERRHTWEKEEPRANYDHIIVKFARGFARAAHGDQRYGEHLYVYHLDQVAELCEPYGRYAQVLAYLHDVLEDTSVKKPDITDLFGSTMSLLVAWITDPPGANRKERKKLLYESLRRPDTPELVLIVKTADRLANVLESKKNNPRLFEMYKNEHVEFKNAVYQSGSCDDLWKQLDEALADGEA